MGRKEDKLKKEEKEKIRQHNQSIKYNNTY